MVKSADSIARTCPTARIALITLGAVLIAGDAAAAPKTETISCNKGFSFKLVYSPKMIPGGPSGVWPATMQLVIAGKPQGQLNSDPSDPDGATWSNGVWSLYQFKDITTMTNLRSKSVYDCH